MKNSITYKHTILFLLLLFATLMTNVSAMANEASKSGNSFNSISNNSITWTGPHATFTFSGSGMSYYGTYKALQLAWNSNYTLSWSVNSGCTINVTEVTMSARTSMEGYITLNGAKSSNISGTNTKSISTGSISKTNLENIVVTTSNNTGLFNAKPNFFVYEIKVKYTITPETPNCTSSSKSIYVTVDVTNPNQIDLSQCFSSTALNSDSHFGSLSYNKSGGTITGNSFYATKAGTYTINAYLAGQNNCHAQSANSGDLTITVSRVSGSINAEGTTITAKETIDLSQRITSSLGEGEISYEVISENKTSATISGNNFTPSASGEYTIKATKAQDDQYNEASTEFTITVNKIENTLSIIEDREIKVDDMINTIYSNKNSDAQILFSISDVVYTNEEQNRGTDVISYNNSTNQLVGLNAGSAKLTIRQNETEAYDGTEKSVSIVVTKYDQTLSWDNEISDGDRMIVIGTSLLDNTASSSAELPIVYSSNVPSSISVNGTTGKLTANTAGPVEITASQLGNYKYNPAQSITRTFTAIEKKQASFIPAWEESQSVDIKVGTNTTIDLVNIATDETFSISATPAGVITTTREGNVLTIHADAAGEATLTLSQAGNDFLDGTTATYTIMVSKYANELAIASGTKAMKVDETWENVITNSGNDNTIVTYSEDGVATYDATNNKITAHAAGTTTITFTQEATATHLGAVKTIDIEVTKISNTLAVSVSALDTEVDGSISAVITNQNNANDIVATITKQTLSSNINNGTDVITYENGEIKAHNAGTAKITFSQAETNKYTAYTSETYTITVSKIANAITVTLDGEQKNSKNVGHGATVTMSLTSTSGATDFAFTRKSGTDEIATIGSNSIVSGQTDGTSIWEISQAETYKYAAATTTVRVKVNSVAEEEGYVLNEPSEKNFSNASYILSGPGEVLSFDYKKLSNLTIGSMNIYGYDAASQKSTIASGVDLSKSYQSKSYNIAENIVKIDFSTGSEPGSKTVRYVKVTRKTYVRATASQANLGDVYTDKTASATFNVSYSSTNGGDIDITSNNSRFTVDKSSISVNDHTDNVSNPETVTVTYTPDPEHLGDDAATITISDRYYTAELTFTATAKKYATTISKNYADADAALDVDGTISNAFTFVGTSAGAPSNNSEDDFYYQISSTLSSAVNNGDAVISYNPTNNTITALNAGTARLTIYQKKTNLYNASSQSFDFTVNKLENKLSISLVNETLEVDGSTNVELNYQDNQESDGSISASFSNIAYTNESQNREGGDLLTYDAETMTLTGYNAGTATVTITQAETYKYTSKSAFFNVSVNKLTQMLSWDNPDLSTNISNGSVVTGNTATSNVGLTVTYSSANTAAITVDATTGELTAKNTGSKIAVTASQAGNYKYLPASISRDFYVFKAPLFEWNKGNQPYYASSTIEGIFTSTNTDTESALTFETTDSDIAYVAPSQDGTGYDLIIGAKVGEVTITVHQAGNSEYWEHTQDYTFTVAPVPTAIAWDLNGTSAKIMLSETPIELDASVVRSDDETPIAGLNVSYTSSNKNVAIINGNTIELKDLGTTTITASFKGSEDGVYTAANQTYTITVYDEAKLTGKFAMLHNGQHNIQLLDNNADAFTAAWNSDGSKLTLTSVGASGIIPQGTPVMIYRSDDATNYQFTYTTEGNTFSGKNEFCVTTEEMTATEADNIFVLAGKKAANYTAENPVYEEIGFFRYVGKIPAGKVYLKGQSTTPSQISLNINIFGEATALLPIEADTTLREGDDRIYTILGMEVGDTTQQGLYIQNGRIYFAH